MRWWVMGCLCALGLMPGLVRAALVNEVNPFIGSGGQGFGVGSAFVGAAAPFGMVRLGPDTTRKGNHPTFYHCAGYYHPDTQIRAFSHTHMHGTGAVDYGNVGLLPLVGEAAAYVSPSARYSRFAHSAETNTPGYYAVTLQETGIRAELTAGERVALHRYTFPATEKALVMVDAGHFIGGGTPVLARVATDEKRRTVTGSFFYKGPMAGRDGGFTTYFVIQSQQPFTGVDGWQNGVFLSGSARAEGTDAGVMLRFATTPQKPVLLRVAISFISLEQARQNMAAELPGENYDFDALRLKTETRWEKVLGRMTVKGGSEKDRRIFYTALYHAFLMPTLFTEAGGRYLGFDKKVHVAKGFRYYTDLSLWDTFRTQHPLLTLIGTDYQRDMLRSLVLMSQQGGVLPRWPIAAGESGSMIGDSGAITLAEGLLKGVSGVDKKAAWAAMWRAANGERPAGARYEGRGGALKDYLKHGYVPGDQHGGSVSVTQEFAYADGALALLAEKLGKHKEARELRRRSLFYQNLFHPQRKFFEARAASGEWLKADPPNVWNKHLVEGTPWQWLWYAPHDTPGLMALMGGAETMTARLDEMFTLSHRFPKSPGSDPYYWHGNEPDLHAAFLYHWAGRADRASEEVRWILGKKYNDTPAGLDGNDDAGTLSAWYLFAASGFYPIAGTTRYVLSPPLFEETTLRLEGGKTLTVRAPGASAENRYLWAATLNGKALRHPWFEHGDIAHGGVLHITLGPTPRRW